VGRLIPAGTGLAYHEERQKRRAVEVSETDELEELLGAAVLEEDTSSADTEEAASA